MLPPVNQAVFDKNPRFKLLYHDLTNSRLNHDGSSRLLKQQKAQSEIEKSLHHARVETARDEFIQEALEAVINQGKVPADLLQSCQIVLAIINGDIYAQDSSILDADIHRFSFQMSEILPLLDAHLHEAANTLKIMSSSIDDSSPLSSSDSNDTEASYSQSLVPQVSSISSSITAQTNAIITIRTRIMELAQDIHIHHRHVLELCIRILEQTIHGSVSRATKARADHLATVAKGLDYKIKILAKSDPMLNNAETKKMLQTYSTTLKSNINKLKGRIQTTSGQLEEFEFGNEGIHQIAQRYADDTLQCQQLEKDIQRLENPEVDYYWNSGP